METLVSLAALAFLLFTKPGRAMLGLLLYLLIISVLIVSCIGFVGYGLT